MKVHLRLGRRRMGLRHVSQLKGPARLGEDLRAALADMVTHRRIRQAHRVVLIDQPGQDPPRRMALLLGRIQVTAQHGVDRGLERLQPRRDPLRGLARRRNRRFQRLTHGAPVHTVLVGQPPNRQPVDPMIAANRRKLLHPRPHPSASTFVTSGPGYPDADHAEAGPVQAVTTVAACRKVGPNQTVKTTPRHHAGGATSSRPPGANSGCHGQIAPFSELVAQVMSSEPYALAKRVFWIVDNGSRHAGRASIERMSAAWPRATLVHLPVHASWLNQIEIVFSVIQRKIIKPADFADLDALAQRLTDFEPRYNPTATPFDWRFTRTDLTELCRRIDAHQPANPALVA